MWDRMTARLSDTETRARLLFWIWVVSLVVLAIGFGVVAWQVFA